MKIGKRKRFRVLQRDGFKCHYCGRPAGDVQLEIDHVVPKSAGGSDSDTNLVAACRDCNQGKGSEIEMRGEWVHVPGHGMHFLYPNAAIRQALIELGL